MKRETWTIEKKKKLKRSIQSMMRIGILTLVKGCQHELPLANVICYIKA